MTDEQDSETIEVDVPTLGQHILTGAREVASERHDTYEEHGMTPEWSADPIEWDWSDVTVEDVEQHTIDGEVAYVVHAHVTGRSSRQVRSATYNPPGKAHPAEYETVRHRVLITAEWFPERAMRATEYTLRVANEGRV